MRSSHIHKRSVKASESLAGLKEGISLLKLVKTEGDDYTLNAKSAMQDFKEQEKSRKFDNTKGNMTSPK